MANRTHLCPILMEYFMRIALKLVGGIIELRKFDFRGLKGGFNGKNAVFRELIAK